MKNLFISILLFSTQSLFAQDVIDYRYAQSSVKSQASRGTCTAFGICAAFEVFPGVPSNMSEQYLFARIKYANLQLDESWRNNDEGEFLDNYLYILNNYGFVSEEVMPYNGSLPIATNDKDLFTQYYNITNFVSEEQITQFRKESYQLNKDAYTYYKGADARNIENIKAALRSGVKAIPVCYNIHTSQWQSSILNLYTDPVFDPNELLEIETNSGTGIYYSYKSAKILETNLEEKILNKKINYRSLLYSSDKKKYCLTDGGHCVAIVGYNKKGFIIKNSWGKDWANKGYATVSYNFHKLLAKEALVLKNFYIKKQSVASPFEILKPNQIRLKTTPTQIGLQKGLICSFFYEGPQIFPEFEKIEMRFYESSIYGKGSLIGTVYPQISEANHANGYQTELPSSIAYKVANSLPLIAEIDFTYNVGTRTITNTYPNIEWKNKTLKNGGGEIISTDAE